MTQTYQSPDGITLSYLDEGEGFPLLCLAGLTRNAQDFDYLVPHLPNVRVIRPDYRGRGKSDWADPTTYTIPVETGDILALLDHLNLEKVAILGTSRGGLIAMGLASVAKQRLLGVCLNDIGPVIEKSGLETIMDYVGRSPTQKTYSDAAQTRTRFLPGFHDVSDERWLAEVKAHYLETETGLELRYDPRLRDAFTAFSKVPVPDLWPYFDALNGLPLALLRGETSEILSVETTTEMRERRPDMHFAQVANRGHVPFLDEPESLRTIHSWLEEMR